MERTVSRKTGILAGLLVLGSLLLTEASFASHAWNNYHWGRTSTPFTLQLGNNTTTGEWNMFLGSVSTDWSAATALDTAVVGGAGGRSCKAKSGTVQVCNKKYGFNGWLGLAQIWISGDHIVQATAKVNDSYFETKTYNAPNAKRHVLCQEVGHSFGLGHHTAVSCMDDRNGLFDPAYVSPNAHDYEQLATIYASHDDATSTVAPALAAAAFDEEGPDHAGEFGRPAGTGRVPEILFVRDLPDGRKLFTWVVPAPPGNPDPR